MRKVYESYGLSQMLEKHLIDLSGDDGMKKARTTVAKTKVENPTIGARLDRKILTKVPAQSY